MTIFTIFFANSDDRSERLYVHVGVVEFPIDLARFDLVQGDLLLDVVEDHQEVFTLLALSRVVVGHCNHSVVVLHDDCR